MRTSIIETVKKNGKVIFGVVAGLGIAAVSVVKALYRDDEEVCTSEDTSWDEDQVEEEYNEPSTEESEAD